MFQQLQDLRTKRARGEGGFTLVELLVVVIIITVISAIAVPIYLGQRGKANDAKMEQDLSSIASLLSAATSTGSPVTFNEEAGVIGTATSTDAGLRSVTVDGTIAVTGFTTGEVPSAGDCVEITRTDGAEGTYCLPGESAGGGESATPTPTPTPSQTSSPPSAPLSISASYVTGVGGRIAVSWSAPSNVGTSAISSYTVTVLDGATTAATVTVDGTQTSANVVPSDGIAVSRTYTVTVTASNDTGAGPASDPSNSVTTQGGTLQTQTFTSNGTFTGQGGIAYDLLIVGGGGAGGRELGGGGGGGQVAYFGGVALVGNRSVVIGSGGTPEAGKDGNSVGTNGQPSSIGTYTAAGGGRGGSTCLPDSGQSGCSVSTNAVPGGGAGVGNGGGANGYGWTNNNPNPDHATASTTPGTGDSGLSGNGGGNTGGAWGGQGSYGGGGAGAGGNASSRAPGSGRLVTAGLFAGNTTRYGGGGGGGSNSGTEAGAHGGGTGAGQQASSCPASNSSNNGGNATVNTGSGGGGAAQGYCTSGGAGGSGIVIVKWIPWL